ncbi:alcohol dehydrogenase catalytic domain-containing protein [Streptomyces noursei]|uniref:alcohol dehydrogenase catalytic domain-containing protein n=1 Tax=Streptomyces noursei TaxID=1971 RepID=UPI0037FF621C
MRAVAPEDQATPTEAADVDLADPQTGEVRMRITAVGKCHSVSSRAGGGKVSTPFGPGHDGSGGVTAVGPGSTCFAESGHVVVSSWVEEAIRTRKGVGARSTWASIDDDWKTDDGRSRLRRRSCRRRALHPPVTRHVGSVGSPGSGGR